MSLPNTGVAYYKHHNVWIDRLRLSVSDADRNLQIYVADHTNSLVEKVPKGFGDLIIAVKYSIYKLGP